MLALIINVLLSLIIARALMRASFVFYFYPKHQDKCNLQYVDNTIYARYNNFLVCTFKKPDIQNSKPEGNKHFNKICEDVKKQLKQDELKENDAD